MNTEEQRVMMLATRLAWRRDYGFGEAEALVLRALKPRRPDDDYQVTSVRLWVTVEETKEALWQAVRPLAEPALNWLLRVTGKRKRRGRR